MFSSFLVLFVVLWSIFIGIGYVFSITRVVLVLIGMVEF